MDEEKKQEVKKRRFKLKLKRWDVIAIAFLIIFVILISIPTFLPKDNCEVARPEYKCATFKDVMIENCNYWGEYGCDTQADVSLTQIEWYIGNLCNLQNQYHSTNLDCSTLQIACNQITGEQTCPVGFT
jgi:hypothetical protein